MKPQTEISYGNTSLNEPNRMSFRKQKKKQQEILADTKSIGSRDITLSLSSPRSIGEVSWSSSEGSSYDTAEDMAGLYFGNPKSKITAATIEEPLPAVKASADPPSPSATNKALSNEAAKTITCCPSSCTPTKSTECNSNPPKSRLLRPFARTNPESRPKLDDINMILLHSRNDQLSCSKRRYVLDNVEIYSVFELACGKEDVSTVHFLTKEDTNKVFTKRVIPLEIATQSGNDELSAVSTSVAGSTESLGDENLEEWSQRVVHHTEPTKTTPTRKDASPTNATNDHKVTQIVGNVKPSGPRANLTEADDVYILEEISISFQHTISSLESSLTWDSQQDGSNDEGNGSEDAVRGPLIPRRTMQREDEFDLQKVTLSPAIVASSRNTEKPDETMDERIKQLKEKIKNMQKASNLPEDDTLPTSSNETNRFSSGVDSISMESTVSGLPSEAVTTFAATAASAQLMAQSADAKHNIPSCDYGPNGSLGKSTKGYQSKRFHRVQCTKDESATDQIPVPAVISAAGDLEDISLIDGNSRSQCMSTWNVSIDIESAALPRRRASLPEREEWFSKAAETARNYAGLAMVRLKEFISLLLKYAQDYQKAFKTKSSSEKAVTLFIATSLLIFFILLLALIA